MFWILTIIFLFFLLTPGILWSYSKKTNKYSIAFLHASVFAFIWYFIHKQFNIIEGMERIEFVLKDDLFNEANKSKVNKAFGKYLPDNVYVRRSNKKGNKFVVIRESDGAKTSLDITQSDIDAPSKIKSFIKKYRY
jgi:hypothetical protein